MSAKRKIAEKTIKSLYGHSGNICAFPACNVKLIENEDKNYSNICHIYGLNPGSARYDTAKKIEELNHEDNLILLCPTHHKIVDEDGINYPANVLKNYKREHESMIAATLDSSIQFNNYSMIYEMDAVYQYLVDREDLNSITYNEVEQEIAILSK